MDGTIARQAMVKKLMARGVYTHPTIIDNVAAALDQCPEPPPSQVSVILPLLVCLLFNKLSILFFISKQLTSLSLSEINISFFMTCTYVLSSLTYVFPS